MDPLEQTNSQGVHRGLQAALRVLKTESPSASPTSPIPARMSTSRLSATKLDALLTQYGASTVGSTERKRERLQRFIDARLDRHIARNAETAPKQLRRSARLASNVAPSPSSAPALSPVRRPATPTQNRMTTRSMAQATKTVHPRAMSPTPSPVRRRSHPMVTRSQNPRSAARVALERIRDILSAYLA